MREHHVRDAAKQNRGDRAESAPTTHDQPRVELVGDLGRAPDDDLPALDLFDLVPEVA